MPIRVVPSLTFLQFELFSFGLTLYFALRHIIPGTEGRPSLSLLYYYGGIVK